MNSTEDENRARAFYKKRLASVFERLQARDADTIPLGPDDAESWYAPPPSGIDFVAIEDLESALREFWNGSGFEELAELAPHFARLAERLEVREQDESEISPFVYVMY